MSWYELRLLEGMKLTNDALVLSQLNYKLGTMTSNTPLLKWIRKWIRKKIPLDLKYPNRESILIELKGEAF